MQIENNKVVSLHYRLTETDGEELEDTYDEAPIAYLHGHAGIMASVQNALNGKQAGDQVSVSLEPEQAYGAYRENAEQRIPIKHLYGNQKKLKVGQIVAVNTREGARDVTILKVGKFNVDVNTNHPFAGKAVTFDIEIVDVRDATAEEIAHGHAHGAGGHQH